jgi:hypothetical protein
MAKLTSVYSATLPGVVADNTTDNYAVIQAALNAHAGPVVLPPGQIVITSPLVMPNGGELRSLFDSPGTYDSTFPPSNSYTTTIRKTGNGDTIQVPSGSTRAKIQGLRFDGGNNVRTAGSIVNIAAAGAGEECQFQILNCLLVEAPDWGVFIGANRRACRIINSTVYSDTQSTQPAVQCDGSDVSITDSIITNASTTQDAIYLNSDVMHIIGCDIFGSRNGININSGKGHEIIGCGIDRNQQQGIYVSSSASDVMISSCYFHSNSQGANGSWAHIKSDSTSFRVSVTGCSFGPLDGGITNRVNYGVQQGSGGFSPVVTGCTFDATSTTTGVLSNAPQGLDFLGPNVQGLQAWAYDPNIAALSGAQITRGVLQLVKIPVPVTISATNIVCGATLASTGGTSGQNFAALYDFTGARLGVTADQTTAWGTAGMYTMAITGGPISVAGGPGVFIWGALLANAGTSSASFYKGSGVTALLNFGLTAATYRFAQNGSALTALPSTITPASNTQNTNGFWMGIS